MDILSISSILPIPGLKDNDFVFQTYKSYRRCFPGDRVVILKPVKYDLNPLTLLRRRSRLQQLKGQRIWDIDGFRVIVLPFLSAWRARNLHALVSRSVYYLNRRRIRTVLSDHSFQIVHSQFILPDGLLGRIISAKCSIPYFVTSHNESFYFEHRISRKVSMEVLEGAKKVLPINHTNFSKYKGFGLGNLCLSPLGFSGDFVRPQKKDREGRVRILSVCSLIRLKNIHMVLQALALLPAEADFHYTVLGDGPERASLEELTEDLGLGERVSFKGNIEAHLVPDEMYRHDIFIMPSYFETFGRVYFESMAMGIPIICAKNSGIFGIFEEGKQGVSVDHTNVDDIRNALELLISDPGLRLRMGNEGKKLAEVYTWERVAESLHDHYETGIKDESDS